MREYNIQRRDVLGAAASAGLAGVAGCLGGSGGSDVQPIDIQEFPPANYERELTIMYAFLDWVEWAAGEFENQYDMNEVVTAGFAQPSEWFSQLQSGQVEYDIINATTNYAKRSMEEDLIEPLPVDVMPGWDQLGSTFQNNVKENFQKDGEVYALPMNTLLQPALGYNTDYFDSPPSSWGVLWEEDLGDQMAMWNRGDIAGPIAAFYTGQQWDDPDDWDEIREVLENQVPLNVSIWDEYQTATQMFINEEIVVGPLTMGRLFGAHFDQGAPVNYTIPEEGSVYSQDLITIPSGAANTKAATMFADWAIRPENATELFFKNSYRPAIEDFSTQLQQEDVSKEVREFVSWEDYWDRLQFGKPLTPEVQQKYADIWTDVTAGQ